jgi:hypothetical protein
MQRGKYADHLLMNGTPIRRRDFRQAGVPKNTPLHVIHEIEGRADDRRVFTQHMSTRYGHISALQRDQHPILSLNGMGRWQKFAWRLAPQNQPVMR